MTKRRRSYAVEKIDYYGIVAEEAKYDDGFDKWEDMVFAFKNTDKILIKRSHGDSRESVGFTTKWDLDNKNKNVTIYINKENLDEDIEFDEHNQVSVEWEMCKDDKNKIIGINHICIGNTFKQKCNIDVCNIVKQRGDEPITVPDAVDEPDEKEIPAPDEQEGSEETIEVEEEISQTEEITNKILLDEVNLLKEQIQILSKAKEEPKSDPESEADKKPKLGFKDKMKHDIPTTETEKKSKTGFSKWNFINN